MGKYAKKTPHAKLKKKEKAKTKLKVSHKTVLPKGQNVTNTSFKVRKICVRGQLKPENADEIVSRSNHNVKELLSRLHHHNALLRCNALSSLVEITGDHPEKTLNSHLPALLHASLKLTLDKEVTVRCGAIKLLTMLLHNSNETQLSPLFDITVKYLICAMSDIDGNVRTSSLDTLDTLIKGQRLLTARHSRRLLPAFLDLISVKSDQRRRKLHNVERSSTTTDNAWRVKVLARMRALLEAIVDVRMADKSQADAKGLLAKTLTFEEGKKMYVGLYANKFETSSLNLSNSVTQRVPLDETTEFKNCAAALLPLLCDIHVEITPNKRSGQRMSAEATLLSKYISDIVVFLWKIFEYSDHHDAPQLKKWFRDNFENSIKRHFIRNHHRTKGGGILEEIFAE